MNRPFLVAAGLLVFAASTACSNPLPPPAIPADVAGWHGPVTASTITEATINEASGLAPSHRAPGILWINNDSGGEPVLYAVRTDGTYLGSVRIKGAVNYDWEDVTSCVIDGQPYLVAADVGDNYAKRDECVLYVIAEPDPAELDPKLEIMAEPVRVIRYVYPDGPRDCENVAVDATESVIYLASKRTLPPVIYTLPFAPEDSSRRMTAKKVGPANGIPEPTGPLAKIDAPWGKVRHWPCSLDITPDGRRAVLLSYGEPYLYERHDGESWADAFAREGVQLATHGLIQAEGACFSPDGKILYVVTEGTPAPLLTYTLTATP
jgi:hypothetical protein